MPLGTKVGDSVLDEDPIFGQYLLRPNGCMDQDVTWYAARSRPMRLCVRWEPRSSSVKRRQSPLPNFRPISIVAKRPAEAYPLNFRPMFIVPNSWMDQDGTWHGDRPQPRRLCVRWGPSSPSQKGGGAPSPIFGPCLLWPNGCIDKMALGVEVGLGPGHIVLDGDPAPLS